MSTLSNCYICGQFVGKDGNHDIGYDGYNGGYEQGYPTCGKHTKHNKIACEKCGKELNWKNLCGFHNVPICPNCNACSICLANAIRLENELDLVE